MKKDIRKLSLSELKTEFIDKGEKPFRAKQVYEWLWKKSATSFDDMTNLSKSLRQWLEEFFEINAVKISDRQQSADGTIKYAFELTDGNKVEGVLIPTDSRITACISTQVGCSLTCKFCATGYLDRKRNLDPAEIVDQVVLIRNEAQQYFDQPLTNIVYMGMGEPLLNYKGTLKSAEIISSEHGLGMSPKRITVSTAGVARMIKRLGDDEVKFNLALSLHAANDVKRGDMMPINDSNSLNALADSLNYFYQKTKSKVTLEYIVFNDINDEEQDALELVKFARKVPSKVNIIEYNPIEQADFLNADIDKIEAFAHVLEKNKITVNVRRSRGKDIDAACGQLAGKSK